MRPLRTANQMEVEVIGNWIDGLASARGAGIALGVALAAGLGGGAAAEDITPEEILERWQAQQDAPAAATHRGLALVPAATAGVATGTAAATSAAAGSTASTAGGAGGSGGGSTGPAVEPTVLEFYDQDITVDLRITFESNSAAIRPAAAGQLASLCSAMRDAPTDWRFNIIGHADASGDATYNERLSGQRAAAVAGHLTGQCGVDGERFAIYGLGEERLLPDVPAVSEENRRVEVSIMRQ